MADAGSKGSNPPEVAVAVSDTILSADLDLAGIQAPMGTSKTPRYWESANIGQRGSPWDSLPRRCPITMLVKDERSGQLKRETVAYAYGKTAYIARARAELICRAVGDALAKSVAARLAPLLLLIPLRILEVTL